MEILLILLIIFVFFPLLKFFFAVGKTAHTFKQAYNQQAQQQQKAQQQQAETSKKDGRKERLRHFFRKASEDVDFEEIKTDRNTNPTTDTSSAPREPNVSDAHFEDVK